MSDINSNCSRIDAAKATANQLQMQLYQAPQMMPESDSYRKAQNELQALDKAIKSNNAQKAETEVSTASTAVKELSTQDTPVAGPQRGLDVYA